MIASARIRQLEKQVKDLKDTGADAIDELTNAIEFCETNREDWPKAHEKIDAFTDVIARCKKEG